TRQGAEQVVRRENHLRVVPAHDRLEIRRALHAPDRAIQHEKRLVEDMAGIELHDRRIGQRSGELAPCTLAEGAARRVEIVDEQDSAKLQEALQTAKLGPGEPADL